MNVERQFARTVSLMLAGPLALKLTNYIPGSQGKTALSWGWVRRQGLEPRTR